MITRSTQITSPLNEKKLFDLDNQLKDVFSKAIQFRYGTYVGDGRASHSIETGMYPVFLYIQRVGDLGRDAFPVSGNGVFSLSGNSGVSYIPGTGFVKDAVLSYSSTGFSIGVNANVNTVGTTYCYFILA